MKKRRAILLLLLIGAMMVPPARGELSLSLRGGYFQPADAVFKDIYSGGVSWGGALGLRLGSQFWLWMQADRFARTGKLTFTQEETRLTILPLLGGLRFFFLKSKISPYLGGGLGSLYYRETNPIGQVKKWSLAGMGEGGILLQLPSILFFDFQVRWTKCRVNPAGVEAELGGWLFAGSLGFNFSP